MLSAAVKIERSLLLSCSRVGKEAEPGVGGDQIGADAETLPRCFAHVPAGVGVEVGRGHEGPADAFGLVRADGKVVRDARRTEEEHVADVVLSIDIALGGGFSIPVQGFARMEPGGESVTQSHLGCGIAGLGFLCDRSDVAHAHSEGAAQIILGKGWMGEQQG